MSPFENGDGGDRLRKTSTQIADGAEFAESRLLNEEDKGATGPGEPEPRCEKETGLELIEGVAGATEDVFDFVADKFLDASAGGAEVLARIELLGAFDENLADGGRHGEAEIGIDVYLCAAGAASDLNIGFRNSSGVFAHFAAVFIDVSDEVFRNAGGAVEDERIIAKTGIEESFLDGFEAVEIEVLFAFEFVSAM